MSTIRLNEQALAAAGLDRVNIEALRHLVRQVGQKPGAMTLPQVAEQTDILNPALVGLQLADADLQSRASILEAEQAVLQLADAALQVVVAILEAEQISTPTPDRELRRMLDDLSAELQDARTTNNALARRIDDLENRVN